MAESIERLAKYLTDAGYPGRITPKMLAAPTGKDFQSIMSFLLRLIDPTFVLSASTGKMEDDVQMVFKVLKYPFQISKTSLTAVGSQQSWPALLGAIMWLVEVLEVRGWTAVPPAV
jgi:kinetochore protein NDC80